MAMTVDQANVAMMADMEYVETDYIVENLQAVMLYGFGQAVKRSPVNTGYFRSQWNVSVGSIDDTTTNEIRANTVAEGEAVIEGVSTIQMTYVTNSTEYAIPLATGHSLQAPEGWIDTIATEIAHLDLGISVGGL